MSAASDRTQLRLSELNAVAKDFGVYFQPPMFMAWINIDTLECRVLVTEEQTAWPDALADACEELGLQWCELLRINRQSGMLVMVSTHLGVARGRFTIVGGDDT